MEKKVFSTKTVVAIAIGAALFFVIARFVAIPSGIPNTNISLQYAVLAFVSALFGPVAGALVGLIGHTLTDLTYGSVWWSWVIGSGIHGLIAGLACKKLSLSKGTFSKEDVITFVVINLIASAVAWILVAPVGDIVIYAEPVNKVFTQGIVAAISNSLVAAIGGGLLCLGYTKTIAKEGSLDKE